MTDDYIRGLRQDLLIGSVQAAVSAFPEFRDPQSCQALLRYGLRRPSFSQAARELLAMRRAWGDA